MRHAVVVEDHVRGPLEIGGRRAVRAPDIRDVVQIEVAARIAANGRQPVLDAESQAWKPGPGDVIVRPPSAGCGTFLEGESSRRLRRCAWLEGQPLYRDGGGVVRRHLDAEGIHAGYQPTHLEPVLPDGVLRAYRRPGHEAHRAAPQLTR